VKIRNIILATLLAVSSSTTFAEYVGNITPPSTPTNGTDPSALPPGMANPAKVDVVLTNSDSLLRDPNTPVGGNPNGKISIVEFFDYQCSHCIATSPTIVATVKANKDVRIVYMEFPLGSSISNFAARAALAAKIQGKYVQLHDALMRSGLGLTEDKVMALAKSVGLDTAKLTTDMNSPAIADILKANYKLAQSLGISGTPVIIVAPTNLTKTSDKSGVFYILGRPDYIYLQNLLSKVNG
jgi:protein-disulfide isomerase